jgi:CheY-like chemotaxis protein
VESGTVTIETTTADLDQFREAMLREFEPVARKKDLGFSIELMPGCPQTLVTEPTRLQQIAKNLIANAFKFTDEGSVRVRIEKAHSGWSADRGSLTAASDVISIAVIDTGIGIALEDQQRIFEAFAQCDGSTAREYDGTGLGLSISRELVGLLGGEVTLHSAPGRGSTFTVFLPSGPPPVVDGDDHRDVRPTMVRSNGAATPGSPRSPLLPVDRRRPHHIDADSLAGTKVLVVDDDYRNIFAMTALLESGQAQVSTAESGRDAIASVDQAPVDIILMDIMMPNMDGYEAIRAIRSTVNGRTVPIVALTGKAQEGERDRCLNAGANDYVSKPVDSDELLAVLRPWLTVAAPTAP